MLQLLHAEAQSFPNFIEVEEPTKLSNDQANALQFITAGNATFTIENLESGNRFTYKVKAPSKTTENGGKTLDLESNARFVSVLCGPDNYEDYNFLGTIFVDTLSYYHGKRSRINWNSASAQAFKWTFNRLLDNALPSTVEIHHSGTCGRCGRKLTVPESIKSGFGPECINKIGR